MIKDMIIAALAAGLILRHPWFAACTAGQKISVWMALTVCLLFFCLFCEEMHEKWLKYKERVSKLQELLERLAEGKGGQDGQHTRYELLPGQADEDGGGV